MCVINRTENKYFEKILEKSFKLKRNYKIFIEYSKIECDKFIIKRTKSSFDIEIGKNQYVSKENGRRSKCLDLGWK